MRYRATPLSELAYRCMVGIYALQDLLVPGSTAAIEGFGIQEGMTVVDYGCGPGRYLVRASRLVGPAGTVYAADVSGIGLRHAARRVERYHLANVRLVPIAGARSAIPDRVADLLYALDMFHAVEHPREFLAELRRIAKPDAVLILEDGHQPRPITRRKVLASGLWTIREEARWHLRCVPAEGARP